MKNKIANFSVIEMHVCSSAIIFLWLHPMVLHHILKDEVCYRNEDILYDCLNSLLNKGLINPPLDPNLTIHDLHFISLTDKGKKVAIKMISAYEEI